MGTNFYWHDPERLEPRDDDPKVHIGKRSAAGLYCWDCRITLCKYGEGAIHNNPGLVVQRFREKCPRCGTKPRDENLGEGAAGVELGLAKPHSAYPSGVSSCASFTWAQHPADVGEKVGNGYEVIDEYGNVMTGKEFLDMLKHNCPIQFHCIGEWFS